MPARRHDPGSDYQERFDLYRLVYETRNLELRLFWERSNYFLALNTAIALGYFTIDKDAILPRLLLCFFGVVAGLLWVATNLGSKFWQARWEHRLIRAEEELGPHMRLFSDGWDVIVADAKSGLENRRKGRLDRLVNCAILLKPSVSRTMILLSAFSVVFWVLATVLAIVLHRVSISCSGHNGGL